MDDKKIPMRGIIGTLLVLACIGVYCIGVYCIVSDMFDIRRTVDPAGAALERAGREQREAEKSIDLVGTRLRDSLDSVERVTERTESAAERINASADRQRESQKIIADSERRISECKQVIQAVRKTKEPR